MKEKTDKFNYIKIKRIKKTKSKKQLINSRKCWLHILQGLISLLHEEFFITEGQKDQKSNEKIEERYEQTKKWYNDSQA